MDSENRVTEATAVERFSLELKENENNIKDVLEVMGDSEDLLNVDGLNSSGFQGEGSATVSTNKPSSLSKKHEADHTSTIKKNKIASNARVTGKGHQTAISRIQKPSFSKSLSFPAKQNCNNGSKNNEEKVVKTNAKNFRVNGTEAECSVSSHKRRVSTGGSSMANLKGLQSMSGKSSSVDAAADDPPPSEVNESNDQNIKAIARLSLIKDEEDAHSTSSLSPRGSRRRSSSEFTFRVVERAEKRKEFYTKLEEKTHAMELERKNMQAKSKECQEAEIKQLRKSMAFVANPMPSFYREPPPPKVELKKVPTTRAISPKLGRHIKIAVAASDNSSESGGFVESPRVRPHLDRKMLTKINSNKDSVALKNTIQKSLTKLPSKKSRSTKIEGKPLNSKQNKREPENLDQKVSREETENQNKSIENSSETETTTEIESIKNPVKNETILNLPSAEITPEEVPVKS